MKRCVKCGEERFEADFNRERARKDGLYPYCKECHRTATRAQKRGPRNRQKAPDYAKKQIVRSAVGRALRRGDLQRATACMTCGGIGRIEAHHEDYSKPLDVLWLCSPCHALRHPRP